mgnify:CR=1 FL=1
MTVRAKEYYRITSGEKIAKLLADPATNQFTKDIILAGYALDPCQIANDLELLSHLFDERADSFLESSKG